MSALPSMEYPYWLMIAGAVLLMLGFVGLVRSQRIVEVDAGHTDSASDHEPSEPEAELSEVDAYHRIAKEKRKARWVEAQREELSDADPKT
jgi:hypothetical protein